jgi:hypothetical protein
VFTIGASARSAHPPVIPTGTVVRQADVGSLEFAGFGTAAVVLTAGFALNSRSKWQRHLLTVGLALLTVDLAELWATRVVGNPTREVAMALDWILGAMRHATLTIVLIGFGFALWDWFNQRRQPVPQALYTYVPSVPWQQPADTWLGRHHR